MNNRIPVEALSFGVQDMKPVNTDWSPEEYVDDQWRFWQAFEYDLDGRSFTLIASQSSVVAAYTEDGIRIDMESGSVDLDDLECESCAGSGSDENEDPCRECNATGNTAKLIVPDQTQELERVEPYLHGAEGPMMNYRYPTGDSADNIGGYGYGCDAVEAAYRLRDTPLCIVEYDDEIALALTGGGMDLTWEIVDAFTLLGYLPPVHFCDLPGMAGYPSNDDHRYIIAAVDRSLSEAVNTANHRLESHRRQWDPAKRSQ